MYIINCCGLLDIFFSLDKKFINTKTGEELLNVWAFFRSADEKESHNRFDVNIMQKANSFRSKSTVKSA